MLDGISAALGGAEKAITWLGGGEVIVACTGGVAFALMLMLFRGHRIPWVGHGLSLPPDAGWLRLIGAVIVYAIFTYPATKWLYGAVEPKQWFMATFATIDILAGKGLLNGVVERALAQGGGAA